MCPPLSNDDAFNSCSTAIARFSPTLVDLKMILKFAAAINPVDTGAVGLDPSLQNLSDALQKHCGLCWCQAGSLGFGVQPGLVQGFICVDIADTGNEALIQQQRLELSAAIF